MKAERDRLRELVGMRCQRIRNARLSGRDWEAERLIREIHKIHTAFRALLGQ